MFSDNCAAQYKCKGTFADLTQYQEQVQRIYFGAEHGKGEADGETGTISKLLETDVLGRQAYIRHARDFYTWCVKNITKDEVDFKREFVYVESHAINRQRPHAAVQPVKGCRKLHQVVKVSPYVMKARHLACLCQNCRRANYYGCINKEYVGLPVLHSLQLVDRTDMEEDETDNHAPTPSEDTAEHRQEFFVAAQQELLRARRFGFGSFTACAQDILRRAASYPLSIPDQEPAFQKQQVDEVAENQRPECAVPAGRFAKLTAADGNCLARAISFAVFGTDSFHTELRIRIVCELALREMDYLSANFVTKGTDLDGRAALQFFHVTGDFYGVPSLRTAFECEVMAAAENSKDMGMWHLLAAANVLQCQVISVYPLQVDQLSRTCYPDHHSHFPIYVQWTSNLEDMVALSPSWTANHFVSVVQEQVTSPPRVGDHVLANVTTVDGATRQFYALVIDPPSALGENELFVMFFRASGNGRFYVADPADKWPIAVSDVVKVPPPTINSRGHHFF